MQWPERKAAMEYECLEAERSLDAIAWITAMRKLLIHSDPKPNQLAVSAEFYAKLETENHKNGDGERLGNDIFHNGEGLVFRRIPVVIREAVPCGQ